MPFTVGLLIPALSGCPSPPQTTAREELAAYMAAHPDIEFEGCPEAELDDCGVNPDTAFPSAVVLECVYAAKQTCTPTWGCVVWATFDAIEEYCLLVEDGTCNVLYFNTGAVSTCETMEEPEDCVPILGACTALE